MNRIIASVGLVALGAANVHAQMPQTTTMPGGPMAGPAAKWWNVSATVRGFYDDNLNSVRHPSASDRAWGGEITPQVGINIGNDQTTFEADYKYAFLYYDHKPLQQTKKYDQDHTFNMLLNHAFTERYNLRVRDAFVIGQEPDALRYDAAIHTPYRVSGGNIVNSGGIAFDASLTPQFGVEVGYNNAFYDYSDTFAPGKNSDTAGDIFPSVSGALDRIEHTPYVSGLWHLTPQTTASLSYQYGQINYTANEPIAGNPASTVIKSDVRNNRSHTGYLGLDHQFNPNFYGSAEAGASYYDYYNAGDTSFYPYARLSLTYIYAEESSVTAGFQEGRGATDVVGGSTAGVTKKDLVLDSGYSTVYGTIRQRIIPHLFANVIGTAQHAIFNGGGSTVDNKAEDFYQVGLNLEDQFTPHFSTHVGYDFNRLDSDIGRSYTRNKAYVGATASF